MAESAHVITGECVLKVQLSETFASALQKVGVPSRLITIPGGSHGPWFVPTRAARDAPRPANWPDYFGETVRWFDQYLKGVKATK